MHTHLTVCYTKLTCIYFWTATKVQIRVKWNSHTGGKLWTVDIWHKWEDYIIFIIYCWFYCKGLTGQNWNVKPKRSDPTILEFIFLLAELLPQNNVLQEKNTIQAVSGSRVIPKNFKVDSHSIQLDNTKWKSPNYFQYFICLYNEFLKVRWICCYPQILNFFLKPLALSPAANILVLGRAL